MKKTLLSVVLAVAFVVSAAVVSAAPASAQSSGSELTDAGLEQMIFCESNVGGRYQAAGGSFRGAVQWVTSTWRYAAPLAGFPEWGETSPNLVPPDVQDAVTKAWWAASNPRSQWPVCHREALAVMDGTRTLERVCDPGNEWGTGPLSRRDGTCAGFGNDAVDIASPNQMPVGNLDRAWVENGRLVVGGWAWDFDFGQPRPIHVWTDSQFLGALAASRPRADLAFDGAFHAYFDLPPGADYACVAVLDGQEPTLPTWLGCIDIIE